MTFKDKIPFTMNRYVTSRCKGMSYHHVMSNGRAYLCGCFRGIRINGKVKYGGRIIKRKWRVG